MTEKKTVSHFGVRIMSVQMDVADSNFELKQLRGGR